MLQTKLMNQEIEKKFLLTGLPTGLTNGTKISQGYLNVGNPEVRVRVAGEKFTLTKKSGEGLVREEQECEISKEVFEILWSLTGNARIEKIRYEITGKDGLKWEIDEFQTDLTANLFLAEVELPDESVVPEIPRSIAEVIKSDVTADERFKNKNLAIYGASANV